MSHFQQFPIATVLDQSLSAPETIHCSRTPHNPYPSVGGPGYELWVVTAYGLRELTFGVNFGLLAPQTYGFWGCMGYEEFDCISLSFFLVFGGDENSGYWMTSCI